MSELKATSSGEIRARNALLGYWWYEKSEADKVIAELEERIADGDKDFEMANDQNERLLKIVRHQKYKRCVAMARIAQDDWHLHNSFYAMGHQEFEQRKCEFYEKWHNRWLELAEKFKEAK